jgi:hypothetical protein
MAGAAAALKLAKAGKSVKLIEARDRCGGRGFLRKYDGDSAELEFGGAWITPWHNRIRALVPEHGLSLRPRHEVTNRLWLRDSQVCSNGAVSPEDITAHERAIARVAVDAILLKKGSSENEKGDALRGISFAAYLDRLQCPKPTRDLFSAWWTVSGNGDHDLVAASEFLASCSYDNGLAEGMINFWSDTVVPGMGALAEAMIGASGAERILSEPVTHVVRVEDGVQVATAKRIHRGEGLRAGTRGQPAEEGSFLAGTSAGEARCHCQGAWRAFVQAVGEGGGRSPRHAGDGRWRRHRVRLCRTQGRGWRNADRLLRLDE